MKWAAKKWDGPQKMRWAAKNETKIKSSSSFFAAHFIIFGNHKIRILKRFQFCHSVFSGSQNWTKNISKNEYNFLNIFNIYQLSQTVKPHIYYLSINILSSDQATLYIYPKYPLHASEEPFVIRKYYFVHLKT